MQTKQCPVCGKVIEARTIAHLFIRHLTRHHGLSLWAATNHLHDEPQTLPRWEMRGRRSYK